jgi:hypothetical protein
MLSVAMLSNVVQSVLMLRVVVLSISMLFNHPECHYAECC